jgi:prolyl-tRNA editing enzyme YbaK/EbsC (Cys-tRNA(Pro) deacylase)
MRDAAAPGVVCGARKPVSKSALLMSLESVRAFLAQKAPDLRIVELDVSTATVAQAAEAHGVAPRQIAKTLSLRVGDRVVLVVASGIARLDNKKVKSVFGAKPRLLEADEVAALTGHPVGGVCPFGLVTPLPIYCDESLRSLGEVVPAAGATNAAVRIDALRLAALVGAEWVDICQGERPSEVSQS